LLAGAGAAFAAGVLVSAVADFLVFLVVLAEPESAAAVPASAELSEVAAFFDLLLDVPPEAAVLSDAALSEPVLAAESAAFLELLFLVVDLLLSAALAELSAASVLFLLLDLVLLLVLAVESVPLCVESSAVVFFLLLFFLVVVELSLWSCEPDEPVCCARMLAPAHKSRQAARSARTAPLLDLIFSSLPFLAGFGG